MEVLVNGHLFNFDLVEAVTYKFIGQENNGKDRYEIIIHCSSGNEYTVEEANTIADAKEFIKGIQTIVNINRQTAS